MDSLKLENTIFALAFYCIYKMYPNDSSDEREKKLEKNHTIGQFFFAIIFHTYMTSSFFWQHRERDEDKLYTSSFFCYTYMFII